jgi:hypothetical protein
VTHIVTDAPKKTTLRALGLRSLKEIPDHVPTVRWTWVPSRLGGVTKTKEDESGGAEAETEVEVERDDDVWMHAAFHERIDAGVVRYGSSSRAKGKGKEKAPVATGVTTEETSHISYVPDIFSLSWFLSIILALMDNGLGCQRFHTGDIPQAH